MRRLPAIILILVVVLFWGSVAAIAKLMMGTFDFFTLQFLMCALASVALFVVVAAKGFLPSLRGLSLRDHGQHFLLGAIGIFVYGSCYFGAISLMPVQEAAVLNYCWPLIAMLLAVPILEERLRLSGVLAALVAFAGVVVVVTKGNPFAHAPSSAIGILLMACAGISYSLYSLLGKKNTTGPLVAVFLHCLYATPLFGIASLLFGSFPAAISATDWLIIAYLGPVTIGAAYMLWLSGVRSLPIRVASTLIYLTPFVALAFVAALVREPIHPASIAGLFLILAGAAWQLWQREDGHGSTPGLPPSRIKVHAEPKHNL